MTPQASAAPHPEDTGDPTDQDIALEGRLRRLEEILTRMEAEDVPLAEALALFEEGIGHVRGAERVLAETELRVEELLSDHRTEPMDIDPS